MVMSGYLKHCLVFITPVEPQCGATTHRKRKQSTVERRRKKIVGFRVENMVKIYGFKLRLEKYF